ncbi:MAG: TolC family protein [gamma proteobacterium endosymbiont of Lamellibrachia anaximandri]|nr:TolC family protein [gamma proteobacterium endosymbiont of Lamellibrachia anaximandri]
MIRLRIPTILIAALAGWICFAPVRATDSLSEPLPSPLTLQQALRLADGVHPDRELADAALQRARAEQSGVDASDDLQLGFEAALKVVNPSYNAVDQSSNDSWAKLKLSKRLYDFGRTDNALAAADAARRSEEWNLLDVRQQRRLEVMARFFDVLLADLEYARENEAMSIAFVRLDKARSRSELGGISDLELLRLENLFQKVRRRTISSQNKQRITRSRLAISLNRPDDLPADLVSPDLPVLSVPESVEALTQRIIDRNPRLKSLRAQMDAAEQQMRAARAGDNPIIRGEVEAATYNRELGGRNPLSAALVLEVPLFTGNRVGAEVALERAHLRERRAELAVLELDLQQSALELWLELDRLRVRREELEVTGDFRDLSLDRSRTLYDLEVSTDLGDSMVRISDWRLQQAETDFEIALAHARLDALAGMLLDEFDITVGSKGEGK